MAGGERPKIGDAVIKRYEDLDLAPDRVEALRETRDKLAQEIKPGDRAAAQRLVRKLTTEARASRFEQATGRPASRRTQKS